MYNARPDAMVDLPFLRATNIDAALNLRRPESLQRQPMIELSANICHGINLIGVRASLPLVWLMNL
tara:strand:- start:25222 stop:25419 length:198 start_codon:yes stop_codon:yes gene_type:complete